jgi:hypothetical protein
MATHSIGFRTPPPKDGMGNSLPKNQKIPRFTGRKSVKLPVLIKELDDALADLSDIECSFWACDGPLRVRNMCTCRKCYSMRTIAKVRAALNMAHNFKKDLRQQYSR